MAGIITCWHCGHRYDTLKTNFDKKCAVCRKRPSERVCICPGGGHDITDYLCPTLTHSLRAVRQERPCGG